MNIETEDRVLRIAKALSDKTRIKILEEIAKKGSVKCGDVEGIASLSQPTFSHHLKILNEAGLLITKRFGRCVIININDKMFEEFAELLSASFKPD
jgi:DNA-binding transcriptional ArsR family regulator